MSPGKLVTWLHVLVMVFGIDDTAENWKLVLHVPYAHVSDSSAGWNTIYRHR